MCGIAGALVYDSEEADLRILYEAIAGCRARGEDSFGVICWSPATGWLEYRKFESSLSACLDHFNSQMLKAPTYYLHTSRAEPTTEWKSQKAESDIPPFRSGSVAVAHNGIICNDQELEHRYKVRRQSSIDTAVLPDLIQRLGIWQTLKELVGGSALGILAAEDEGRLYVCRNFLPLTLLWQPGLIVFVSEAKFIAGVNDPFPPFRVWEMPPFTVLELSPAGYRGPFKWGEIPDCLGPDGVKAYPQFA
jgi:7-cyano-7-deazaguanine synthase